MATEVSSLARMLGGYVDENRDAETDRTTELVTRDFLGGAAAAAGGGGGGGGVKELDLDLAAPAGWERRLDLKSGEVFLQRTGHATAPTGANKTDRDRSPPPLLPLFPSPTLDRALVQPAPTEYQSVCTLDKVKSALDRLASAAAPPAKKPAQPNRCSGSSSASASASCSRSADSLSRSVSPTSSSTTASSLQRHKRQISREAGDSGTTTEEDGAEGPAMVATGCPSCLSYVLISCTRPRCPRCGAYVPPPQPKKPRLDLNLNSFSAVDRAGTSNRRS